MRAISPKKVSSGFTLIEVMIVLAIVAVLAAVAMPSYADYIRKANMQKIAVLGNSLATKQIEFYTFNGRWASDTAADREAILGDADTTVFNDDYEDIRAVSSNNLGGNGQILILVNAEAFGENGADQWLRLSITDDGSTIKRDWCESDGGGGPDTPIEAHAYLC